MLSNEAKQSMKMTVIIYLMLNGLYNVINKTGMTEYCQHKTNSLGEYFFLTYFKFDSNVSLNSYVRI